MLYFLKTVFNKIYISKLFFLIFFINNLKKKFKKTVNFQKKTTCLFKKKNKTNKINKINKKINKKTNKKKETKLKKKTKKKMRESGGRERERGGNIVIAHRCEGKVVILHVTVTPLGGQTLTGEVSVFFKTSGILCLKSKPQEKSVYFTLKNVGC